MSNEFDPCYWGIDTIRKFKEVKNGSIESECGNKEATDAQEACEKKEAHRNG